MYKTDTICAIASAMTNAGIGIIRVSGSDAIEKVDRIYKGKQKLTEVESHTVQYGHIVYDDKVIDEVMVLVLKAPRTYTTEDREICVKLNGKNVATRVRYTGEEIKLVLK